MRFRKWSERSGTREAGRGSPAWSWPSNQKLYFLRLEWLPLPARNRLRFPIRSSGSAHPSLERSKTFRGQPVKMKSVKSLFFFETKYFRSLANLTSLYKKTWNKLTNAYFKREQEQHILGSKLHIILFSLKVDVTIGIFNSGTLVCHH